MPLIAISRGRIVLCLPFTAVSSYWWKEQMVFGRSRILADTTQDKDSCNSSSAGRGSMSWRYFPCPIREKIQYSSLQTFGKVNRWRTKLRTFVLSKLAYWIQIPRNFASTRFGDSAAIFLQIFYCTKWTHKWIFDQRHLPASNIFFRVAVSLDLQSLSVKNFPQSSWILRWTRL